MKKLMKYAYVVLAGVLAMTVTSCKDTYEYDGVGAQDPGAFLSVDATELKYAADDEQVLKVTLVRTNSEAAENISLTTDNSHFQVPSSVSFNAGESKKVLDIPFNITGGTTEQVTIAVAEESATVYGISNVTFTITRDFVWNYIGEGVYSCWLFGESWPQPVYQGDGTHLYKLPDCIATGYDIQFELTDDDQHLLNPIAKQETGYVHSDYGMISVEGAANDIKRDGNAIYLPMKYTIPTGQSFGSNYDVLELPE